MDGSGFATVPPPIEVDEDPSGSTGQGVGVTIAGAGIVIGVGSLVDPVPGDEVVGVPTGVVLFLIGGGIFLSYGGDITDINLPNVMDLPEILPWAESEPISLEDDTLDEDPLLPEQEESEPEDDEGLPSAFPAPDPQDDSTRDIVWRALHVDEVPSVSAGIVATSPLEGNSPIEHIVNGATGPGQGRRPSQWISFTRDRALAERWARQSGSSVAQVDLNKVDSVVLDLSTGAGRQLHLGDVSSAPQGSPLHMANKFAKGAKEVLVQLVVPPDAIEKVYTPP